MTTIERRIEPRFKIQVDVVTREAVSMEAEVIEISGSGMRIQAAKSIAPETQVAVFMSLVKEVLFKGKIAWVLESLVEGMFIYQMGISVSAITIPGFKAVERSEKSKLLLEILRWIEKKRTAQKI